MPGQNLKALAPAAVCTALVSLFLVHAQPRLDRIATFHGNGDDILHSLAIDAQGNTYLTGSTTSTDLGTSSAYRTLRAASPLNLYDVVTRKPSGLKIPPRQENLWVRQFPVNMEGMAIVSVNATVSMDSRRS